MTDFRNDVHARCGAKRRADASMLHPLVLAYAGDAVFELYVRTMLIDAHDAKAHALHTMSSRRVCAAAQARAAKAVCGMLDETEAAVYMRGRNAKPGTLPKNADPEDYSHATALEAVLGFVYLSGEQERLMELISAALERQNVDDAARPRPYKG